MKKTKAMPLLFWLECVFTFLISAWAISLFYRYFVISNISFGQILFEGIIAMILTIMKYVIMNNLGTLIVNMVLPKNPGIQADKVHYPLPYPKKPATSQI